MRKDVKVGLAVGIVLIGAVLVYIIIAAGGNAGPSRGGAELVTETSADNQHAEAGPETAIVPQTAEPRAIDPATSEQGNEQLAANVPVFADPPAPASSGFDWARALSGETLPPGLLAPDVARTQTPPLPAAEPSRYAIGATPEPPAPTTRPTGRRLYTVRPGDSYWLIAKEQYGDATFVSHVMRANPEIPANRLRAGMTIVLPERTEVLPPALATAGASSADIPGGANDPNAYTVQPGDSLYKISMKFYGTPNYVEKIYEANRQVIGPDMSKVKAGMVLRLPDRPAQPAAATGR